jgi:hypothetical protein
MQRWSAEGIFTRICRGEVLAVVDTFGEHFLNIGQDREYCSSRKGRVLVGACSCVGPARVRRLTARMKLFMFYACISLQNMLSSKHAEMHSNTLPSFASLLLKETSCF